MALSPDMLQEYFEQAQKCKISWKIEKIQTNSEDQCSTDLTLFIKWENNDSYFMNATLSNKECILDSFHAVFYKNNLKIWNEVEYILDKSNYHSFDYIPNTVSIQNIPYCSENKVEILEKKYYFEFIYWIIFLLIIWVLVFKIYKINSLKNN